MGFRFSKSIRILPGVRLNLSKTGVSTSVGRPGATVNVRGRRVRTTVGLPGSGMSYSEDVNLDEGGEEAPRKRRSGGILSALLRGLLGGR